MLTSFMVSFIGDDKPGLVERLSAVIEANGGNWNESRLSQLGGKFAGLILVSLPADRGSALEAALKDLSATGLSVRVTATSELPAEASARTIRLTVLGPDRPGIVKEVSQALAQRKINVHEMNSEVASAAMSGEMLFSARIDATVPEQSDIDDLRETLDDIANSMTLDIELD